MFSRNFKGRLRVIGTEKWNRVMTVSVGYPGTALILHYTHFKYASFLNLYTTQVSACKNISHHLY